MNAPLIHDLEKAMGGRLDTLLGYSGISLDEPMPACRSGVPGSLLHSNGTECDIKKETPGPEPRLEHSCGASLNPDPNLNPRHKP